MEQIVHIIPLGHEIDRAVKPFDTYRANRVYLLTITPETGRASHLVLKQEHFTASVEAQLTDKDIEVTRVSVDTFNLHQVMGAVAKIIRIELQKGNRVYINMSAAGRLTSVATTLAAMAHSQPLTRQEVHVYYVRADDYSQTDEDTQRHGLSIVQKTSPDIIELPEFQLQLPNTVGQQILAKLSTRPSMRTKDILDYLREQNVDGFEFDHMRFTGTQRRRIQQMNLTRLNKQILNKLEHAGYITREKKGRYNRIQITKSGISVAHITGLVEAK